MKQLAAFLWTIFLGTPTFAATIYADDVVAFKKFLDGSSVLFIGEPARLHCLPPWEPTQGAIPVSIREAVDLGRSVLEMQNAKNAPYILDEIAIQRRVWADRTVWFYLITFHLTRSEPGVRGYFSETSVVVLMDRSIIHATKVSDHEYRVIIERYRPSNERMEPTGKSAAQLAIHCAGAAAHPKR